MKRLAFITGVLCLIFGARAQAPDITALEYYLDVDPGFGNGISVSITPDSLQDVNFSIPTTSLTPGFHVVYVRSQDINSTWSHAESLPFFIAKSTTESRNNLTSLEYYVDLDPGQGNGTPVTVTPDTDLNIVELIPTVSLTPGFHTVYFRTQDAAGVWSMQESRPFFISASTSQTQTEIDVVEYFIDTDPGHGNGISVAVTPSSNLDLIEQIPTDTLSPGFHAVFFRVRDAAGQWSATERKPFFISKSTSQTQTDIDAVEYFIDTDSGHGNGIYVAVTPSSNLDLIEQIPTDTLSPGFHALFFRVRDAAGQWSATERKPFFISKSTSQTQTDIDAVEYFIDTDPGHGNGISVAVTPSSNLDLIEQIPTDTLSPGFHAVFFRVRDAAGQWSATERKPFFISKSTSQTQTEIDAVEYFIDTDPGHDNGISVVVTPSSNIDLMEQIVTDTLGSGFHTIYFRVRDATGQWSATEQKPFFITPSSTKDTSSIVLLEYFFNADPGFNNGQTISVGPSSDINEFLSIPVETLDPGANTLSIRGLDDRGQWSHFESKPFYKDPIRTINTVEYAFDTDPGNGFATPISIVPPENPLDSVFSIFIDTLTADEHDLIVRVRDEFGAWSLTDTMRFEKLSIPPGNALDFDGIDDVVIIPDAVTLDFDTSDFTVEMWVNKKEASTAFENTYAINKWMNAGINPGQNEWTMSLTTDGDNDIPQFAIESGTTVYGVSSTDPITLNQWHHLAGVRDDSVLYLYVDGILQDSTTIPSGTAINNVGRELLMGRSADPQFETKARFEEARIWNVARSAVQIDSAKNTILNGTENGLVAYYRFDQGVPGGSNASVTLLPDRSTNSHNGTLSNFALSGTESNWVLSDVLVGPTTVSAISRMDSTPTNLTTISWNVSFIKPVSGLTDTNFTLAETGLTGSQISDVLDIDGFNWQVDVMSGVGVGNLGLDLTDGITGMTPAISNVPFTGETYQMDRLAPEVGVDSSLTNDPTPALTGTIDDVTASIQITLDGQTLTATNNGDSTWTLTDNLLDSLASGTYDVVVSATDSLGNIGFDGSANELVIDLIPPAITISPQVTNDTVPVLNGLIDDLTATIDVVVEGNQYVVSNNGDGTWSLAQGQISPGLTEGFYDIMVTATDLLGNVGVDTSFNELEIDLTSPTVTVDPLLTNVGSPELNGTINDSLATINVTVDDSTYVALNNGDGTWTLATGIISPVLFAGTYEIDAIATDPAGNTVVDGSSNELVIDTTIPDVTVDVIITNATSPELTGTVNDLMASIQIVVDSIAYSGTNNGDGTWTLANGTIDALSDGIYDVVATATSAAGSLGTDDTIDELVVDTAAPLVAVTTLATEDPRPALSGTVDDPNSTVSIELDGSPYIATNNGEGTWTLPDNTISSDLGVGIYDVMVMATDLAGNTGTDDTQDELEILVPLIGFENDSLMLVALFEQNGGNQWNRRDSWLVGPLSMWYGVEVSNNRVVGVDLSGNNLRGVIEFTAGLEAVSVLNLSDNEITNITGAERLVQLLNLDVRRNRLEFDVIELLINAGLPVNYLEQKPVLLPRRVLKQVGSTHVLDRSVDGGEVYTWHKDSVEIVGEGPTLEITEILFEDEGDYYASVTSSLVPDLTLTTRFEKLRVSSLRRDSLALMAIWERIPDKGVLSADWTTDNMSEWQEISITDNPGRVTGIDLSGAGFSGEMPEDLLDIGGLKAANFSNNDITLIPKLTSLDSLQLFDISGNKLDFTSIVPNVNISGIDFSDQDSLGVLRKDIIRAGEDAIVELQTGGDALKYQWKYRPDSIGDGNDGYINIDGATRSFHMIDNIDYHKMGKYVVEVSSDLVQNGEFKLIGHVQEILASGSIEIMPGYEFSDGSAGVLDQGESRLFKIRSGPFDTTEVIIIKNQKILFEDVVLGDYLLNVRTEPDHFIVKPMANGGIDTVRFIPTYFRDDIDWLRADTIKLRDVISDVIDMERTPPDLVDPFNEGRVMLTVESEFSEANSSGRVEARRRVKKAGCSLRRRRITGGGRPTEDHDFELIAYMETDDNGQVNFGLLPDGYYRLNIQYPGVPMDPNSFLEFEINSLGGEVGYELEATVTSEGIFVEKILGIEGSQISGLKVYPNPADRELHVSYRKLDYKSAVALIFDLNGKMVSSTRLQKGFDKSFNLDVSGLANGIYLLNLISEGSVDTLIASYKVIIKR